MYSELGGTANDGKGDIPDGIFAAIRVYWRLIPSYLCGPDLLRILCGLCERLSFMWENEDCLPRQQIATVLPTSR